MLSPSPYDSAGNRGSKSALAVSTPIDSATNEKIGVIQSAIDREEQGDKAFDPEVEGQEAPKRPFLLTHAFIIGSAMILVVVVEMACIAKVCNRGMVVDCWLIRVRAAYNRSPIGWKILAICNGGFTCHVLGKTCKLTICRLPPFRCSPHSLWFVANEISHIKIIVLPASTPLTSFHSSS
jgi:hypothetical protein